MSANLSVVVAPATRQVHLTLLEQGFLKEMIRAGVRIGESSCGFCIGHGQAPGTGWVSVRTSNRNYQGRCGTVNAQVYLVSPETAAATAIRGVLTDPRDLKFPSPRFKIPLHFPLEDYGFIAPPKKKDGKIVRGPNIVDPPHLGKLPGFMRGVVSLVLPDHISTDHILPAGRWLKYRSNIQEYARHTFEGIDPEFVKRAEDVQKRGLVNIIIAGGGYGQGSSREHAAMCPMFLGVRIILAKSIERIHLANLINHGIVPLTFLDPHSYEQIHRGDDLEFPWIVDELKRSEMITARSPEKGYELKVRHGLSRRQIEILLVGGLHNYVAKTQ